MSTNGIDDNCDGSIDENSAVDGLPYADGDSDGRAFKQQRLPALSRVGMSPTAVIVTPMMVPFTQVRMSTATA